MAKFLFETTGAFQLHDTASGTVIRHEGYTLVRFASPFIQERIAIGQLRLIATVADNATDNDWLDTLEQSGGNLELALAAFLEEFPVEPKPKPAKIKKGAEA